MMSSAAMKLVSTIREEAAMAALDKLLVHLDGADVPYLDDLRDAVDGFKEVLRTDMKEEHKQATKAGAAAAKKAAGGTATKRAPTTYNLFIREETARIKVDHPEMDGKQRLTEANRIWSLRKAEAAGAGSSAAKSGLDSETQPEAATPAAAPAAAGAKKKADGKKKKPAAPIVVSESEDE